MLFRSAAVRAGADAAVPALTVTDTLKRVADDVVVGTIARDGLVAVQTPQAFRAPELLASYRAAADDGFEGTDTAACVTAYADVPVAAVPSTSLNLKVTFPEDVALAAELSAPARTQS